MFHVDAFLTVLTLAAATATASMTISKATIFKPVRRWVWKRSRFFGKLLRCPYCTSHWIAAGLTAVYHPRVVSVSVYADWLISGLLIVLLAAPFASLIFRSYVVMGK